MFLDSDACGAARKKSCALWSAFSHEPAISMSLLVPDFLAKEASQ